MAIRSIDSEQVQSFPNLRSFMESEAPHGQLEIHHRGLPIDLLIEDRGLPTTVFYLHPALVKTVKTIPLFIGRTISTDIDANAVYIADPSLALDERLTLSWYAGNRLQFDLQATLSRIVQTIVQKLNSIHSIFFGASGGGFASLQLATTSPDSVAVVMNPQTNIRKYLARQVYNYTELAWGISEKIYDPLSSISATVDVTALYSRPVPTSVIYLQNNQDKAHVERHWKPFRDSLHHSNYVVHWSDNWGEGNIAAPKSVLNEALKSALTLKRSSETSIVDRQLLT